MAESRNNSTNPAGRPDLANSTDYSAVSKQEMAQAGLLAFFAIAKEWDLTTDEQRKLLGNPSRRAHRWKVYLYLDGLF